ncbi:protein DBF4 homolog A-like [Centruroides sculpturatus]|uniref:protein DBF4 homolog A-like n=1 Tax=Centruroides sculpturatus TaxID=218467 RepID=UPI000C6CB32E|nr:protein DBF4 homolog A-like [Centruroides sculpturatus]
MTTNDQNARLKIRTKRPLRDQSFFLYLKHRNIDESKLQKSIERLGGKMDKFFSKDITCLLVDDDYGSQCSGLEPSTSPQIISPATECEKSGTLTLYSRGLSLLRRSKGNADVGDSSTNGFRPKHTVLDKAQMWGIKITRITKFMEWIKAQMVKQRNNYLENSKSKDKEIISLSAPFIKIEDLAGKYQSQYKMFVRQPRLFFEVGYCESPFDSLPVQQNCNVLKDDCSSHELNQTKSVLEVRPVKEKNKVRGRNKYLKAVKPRRHHFCECCKCTFYNLSHHMNEMEHQKFINNSKNYDCVIDVMKYFPSIEEFKMKNINANSKEKIML